MMRIIEVLYGLPYLLVVILLMVLMGPGLGTIIVALTVTGWVGMARIVRGQVLQIKNYEYEYTKEEAVQEGIKLGKQDVEDKIGENGEVKSEKVLHQTVENGKVKLIILYQVIEDIVQTTPIVRETEE